MLFRSLTVEQHIDQVISADLVIHGWDLARATGQEDRIDPAEIDRVSKLWDGVFMVLGGRRCGRKACWARR